MHKHPAYFPRARVFDVRFPRATGMHRNRDQPLVELEDVPAVLGIVEQGATE